MLIKRLADTFMIPTDEMAASKSMAVFSVDSLACSLCRPEPKFPILDSMKNPSLAVLASTLTAKSYYL